MPVTLHLRKTVGGLIPCDALSVELMDELPMGKDIKAMCTVPRSSAQNRWFHLVLHELFKNQETWPTFTIFRNAIKCALGYADEVKIGDKTYFEPRSIAFHKMDQPDFNQFIERFIDLVCTRILKGMSAKECEHMLRLLDADNSVLGDRILTNTAA